MMYSTRISIHALLAESDYPSAGCHPRGADFYPRSPCGERPPCQRHGGQPGHFYPRSPCGERLSNNSRQHLRPHFYPRSPCGERPVEKMIGKKERVFLSTLSLRRATLSVRSTRHVLARISIHALLAESDSSAHSSVNILLCISIHALLAESDPAKRMER